MPIFKTHLLSPKIIRGTVSYREGRGREDFMGQRDTVKFTILEQKLDTFPDSMKQKYDFCFITIAQRRVKIWGLVTLSSKSGFTTYQFSP